MDTIWQIRHSSATADERLIGYFREWKRLLSTLTNMLAVATVWHGRMQQRRQLRSLDDRILSDVGLSRADVEREASKPFWLA